MAKRKLDRKTLGRPMQADARRETFCIRVTQAEIEALETAAAKADQLARVWARDVLLRAAKRAKP